MTKVTSMATEAGTAAANVTAMATVAAAKAMVAEMHDHSSNGSSNDCH